MKNVSSAVVGMIFRKGSRPTPTNSHDRRTTEEMNDWFDQLRQKERE